MRKHCEDKVQPGVTKRLGLEIGYPPMPRIHEHLLKGEPKMTDMPPLSMQDFFTSVIIPLRADKSIQESNIAFLGRVRLGRLMEDRNMLAVWVYHQHVNIVSLPADVHLP
ncbi:hypothetical protein GQX74_004844 [Glossina fuscipes]|nr:hypothetical protein GQX74_004844 [Glossina fuscipes]